MSTYSALKTLTVSGLSSLTSGSYATSDIYDATTIKPTDVLIELAITTGTVSTPKRAMIWLITSADGTNFSDSANESNMISLGAMDTPSSATPYRSHEFSVAMACGFVPNHFKIVIKNDGGGNYAAGTVTYRELT